MGSGAYGCVCKAVDTETGKLVAIKRIANVFISKTDALRILREVCHLVHKRPSAELDDTALQPHEGKSTGV